MYKGANNIKRIVTFKYIILINMHAKT